MTSQSGMGITFSENKVGNGRFVHQIHGTKANLGFWPNFQPPMTFARWRRADMQI